eukprot:962520-Rhodomonas_salina.3
MHANREVTALTWASTVVCTGTPSALVARTTNSMKTEVLPDASFDTVTGSQKLTPRGMLMTAPCHTASSSARGRCWPETHPTRPAACLCKPGRTSHCVSKGAGGSATRGGDLDPLDVGLLGALAGADRLQRDALLHIIHHKVVFQRESHLGVLRHLPVREPREDLAERCARSVPTKVLVAPAARSIRTWCNRTSAMSTKLRPTVPCVATVAKRVRSKWMRA